MQKKLNAATFGEIMNNAITDADIKLLIEMPEGTQEPRITGTGIATVDFYIVMAAIRPVIVDIVKEVKIEAEAMSDILDAIWAMLRADALEALKSMKAGGA